MAAQVKLTDIEVFNVKADLLDRKVIMEIEAIREFEPVISDYLASLSKNRAGIASLLTNDLKEIEQISYGLPREFAIFSIFENLHSSGANQFAQLITDLLETLNENKLYSSVVLLRAIFECTCFMSYPLDKARPKTRDLFNLIKTTRGKGVSEKYGKILSEIYKVATDAYYSVNIEISGINSLASYHKFANDAGNYTKIHINDAIRLLEKLSKLPLQRHYDTLSEFSHPNFASRLLVIKETKDINYLIEETKYSFEANSDKVAMFQTIFSEIILHTLQSFFAANQRYKGYLDLWADLFEYAKNSSTTKSSL